MKCNVQLIDHMGDDLRVVQAARVSYGEELKGIERDTKLLQYLMHNRHTSPFEHVLFTFMIEAPIFVMRQIMRHRTFSINEVSARYAEVKDGFAELIWREQGENKNKQGSGQPFNEKMQREINGAVEGFYKDAEYLYKRLLEKGVSREQARAVLPVASMTRAYFTIDLHNFLHFAGLRLHPHAQRETSQVAVRMLFFTRKHVPITVNTWLSMQTPETQAYIDELMKEACAQ